MFSKIKRETLRRSKIIQPKHDTFEPPKKSRPPSYSIPPACAAKLSHDMATIINNPRDSDVQFKVGGDDMQENGKIAYDGSTAVTFYAHSLILCCRSRYFATMLDEEKKSGESSECVIYKPHIAPSTFQEVLHYIYTGDVRAEQFETIIQLITVADEMDLEGLSIECQDKLLSKIENILSGERNCDAVPIDVAIGANLFPALNLAKSHSLSDFSRNLLAIIMHSIPDIVGSPNAYATFIDKISSEDLAKIIEFDKLEMEECDIWSLALDWACHQTKLSKALVEECLSKPEYEEEDAGESFDGTKIGSSQFSHLKAMLAPLLPAIRFSLFKPDDYARMVYTINYFLPRRQSLELQQYFMKTDRTRPLDAPRIDYIPRGFSKIIDSTAWKFLRKSISETGGIAGCCSPGRLKFELLFRASEHGFRVTNFHQRCDNKGPTLSIFRSADGHLFGGVNFNHCKSDSTWSSSVFNFLFALADGHHRKDSAIFRIVKAQAKNSFYNNPSWAHVFGKAPCDLAIADSADTNQTSYTNLPNDYNGSGASKTALAGAQNFKLSDYEVFAISR